MSSKRSLIPLIYDNQAIVSSVLLRPHASDPNLTMLPATSLVRQRVEETRVELLRWMKKRWVVIRMEGGFDKLDGWALKEIGHGKGTYSDRRCETKAEVCQNWNFRTMNLLLPPRQVLQRAVLPTTAFAPVNT